MALFKADSLSRVMQKALDSLEKFNNREFYYKQFNYVKEKADTYFNKEKWDSAYIYYSSSLYMADLSSYIQTNKGEIYEKIKMSIKNLDALEKFKRRLSISDSLSNLGGFENFVKSFDILCELLLDSNSHSTDIVLSIIALSEKIERQLGELSYYNIKSDQFSTMYLLLEIYYLLNINKEKSNKIVRILGKKQKAQSIVRIDYSINKTNVKYENLFNDIVYNDKSIFEMSFIPKNYHWFQDPGITFRSTFAARFGASRPFFKPPSKYSNNYFFGFNVGWSSSFGKSLVVDTFNFVKKNGDVLNLNNVKKETNISGSSVYLIGSLNYVSNNLPNLIPPKKETDFRINVGIDLGIFHYAETISNTRNNIIQDNSILTSIPIELTFTTNNNLMDSTRTHNAFIGSVCLRILHGKQNGNNSIYAGIRYSTRIPILTKSNKEFYESILERLDIIGGKQFNSVEIVLGVGF